MQYSLNTILSALLIPTTALAGPLFTLDLPAPTNSTSLSARDQKIGLPSGLTISFWGSPNCEDSTMSLWTGVTYNSQIYGLSAAYTLSRDLIEDEVIDVSAGTGMDEQTFAMTDAITPKSGQYPSPGYIEGGWNVPSQCDIYLESSRPLAPHLNPDGSKACYTPKRVFNCARLWMRS